MSKAEMIAAAIDIGTNTTLALLAESDDGGMRVLKDQLVANRLGEALKDGVRFSAEVIALNVDLLAGIARDFHRDGAEDFAVAGTSALRRARNRAEFIAAVRDVTGLQVEVVGGHDEAALTYWGAVSNREIYPGERVAVLDLGGGSTEIIEGRGMIAGQGYSLDAGSVYLTNAFFHMDPPGEEQVKDLRRAMREQLPPLVSKLKGAGIPWILVGGTSVTLAILKAGLGRYQPESIGGSLLNGSDIERLIASFRGKSAQELQNLPGMPTGRGRSILAGSILLHEMFNALEITEATVSERGLRHGLWLARFGRRGNA
jgi:exopolyphosphatase/guanosine-5'-triphosphate,3'-diphosphate pyrophosphatase